MRLGPGDAKLLVNTYREGVASAVGHDLVIEVTKWEAGYDDGALELTADPASMVVREGNNGIKPLSDKDRRDILGNITKKILGTKPIAFRSTGEGSGELELNGTTRAVEFSFDVAADGSFTASARVRQTDWGIKPYSAMLGALKVRDEVEVSASGTLPAS